MENAVTTTLKILPLEKNHNRQNFSCGVDTLDNYFHQRAGQDLRKQITAIYLLHDQETEKIAGYYTLSATSIELVDLPEILQKKLPSYPRIPATLLGRLAVDKSYRKRGYGEILLIDALKRSHKVSQEIASFAVSVDAIDQAAEQFYKKYGFLELANNFDKKQLFLPMKVIEQL